MSRSDSTDAWDIPRSACSKTTSVPESRGCCTGCRWQRQRRTTSPRTDSSQRRICQRVPFLEPPSCRRAKRNTAASAKSTADTPSVHGQLTGEYRITIAPAAGAIVIRAVNRYVQYDWLNRLASENLDTL